LATLCGEVMVMTVSFLMLGVVIIAALGSLFGYFLEPGRWEQGGPSTSTLFPYEANNPSPAASEDLAQPRKAA
jgi:hypothetical protein